MVQDEYRRIYGTAATVNVLCLLRVQLLQAVWAEAGRAGGGGHQEKPPTLIRTYFHKIVLGRPN